MLRYLYLFLVCFLLMLLSSCQPSVQTEKLGDTTVTTFKKVWYRYHDYRSGKWAWQDKGALVLNDESIEFIGNEYHVIIKDIIDISFGKLEKTLSTDPNKWVKIKYNDDEGNMRKALFMESGTLGWSGALGGNKKMYEFIKNKYTQQ